MNTAAKFPPTRPIFLTFPHLRASRAERAHFQNRDVDSACRCVAGKSRAMHPVNAIKPSDQPNSSPRTSLGSIPSMPLSSLQSLCRCGQINSTRGMAFQELQAIWPTQCIRLRGITLLHLPLRLGLKAPYICLVGECRSFCRIFACSGISISDWSNTGLYTEWQALCDGKMNTRGSEPSFLTELPCNSLRNICSPYSLLLALTWAHALILLDDVLCSRKMLHPKPVAGSRYYQQTAFKRDRSGLSMLPPCHCVGIVDTASRRLSC